MCLVYEILKFFYMELKIKIIYDDLLKDIEFDIRVIDVIQFKIQIFLKENF